MRPPLPLVHACVVGMTTTVFFIICITRVPVPVALLGSRPSRRTDHHRHPSLHPTLIDPQKPILRPRPGLPHLLTTVVASISQRSCHLTSERLVRPSRPPHLRSSLLLAHSPTLPNPLRLAPESPRACLQKETVSSRPRLVAAITQVESQLTLGRPVRGNRPPLALLPSHRPLVLTHPPLSPGRPPPSSSHHPPSPSPPLMHSHPPLTHNCLPLSYVLPLPIRHSNKFEHSPLAPADFYSHTSSPCIFFTP